MKLDKTLTTSDGIDIQYGIVRTKKPFLLFVHGLTGNYTGWKFQLDSFEKKGYSVISFDLRGHGKSQVPQKKNQFSLNRFAEDINELMEKEKIKEVILIGHCFGGVISQVFVNKYPHKVKSLVLIGTTYKDPYKKGFVGSKFLEWIIFKIYHSLLFVVRNTPYKRIKYPYIDCIKWSKRSEFSRIVVSSIFYTHPYTMLYTQDDLRIFNSRNILRKLTIPSLILAGKKDIFFPVSLEKEMNSLNRNFKFVLFDTDHLIPIHKHGETNQEIINFIKGI